MGMCMKHQYDVGGFIGGCYCCKVEEAFDRHMKRWTWITAGVAVVSFFVGLSFVLA